MRLAIQRFATYAQRLRHRYGLYLLVYDHLQQTFFACFALTVSYVVRLRIFIVCFSPIYDCLFQSAKNFSMPWSVSGWEMSCSITFNGIVAMSAPASAAWITCCGCLIEAAIISVGIS